MNLNLRCGRSPRRLESYGMQVLRWCLKRLSDGEVLIARNIYLFIYLLWINKSRQTRDWTVKEIIHVHKKAELSQRWPRDARYISRLWAVAEIWPFEIIQDGGGKKAAILNLFESKIAPLDLPSPKTPPYNQTWSESDNRLRSYGHLKFFQHDGGRHLGFVRIVNNAVRSAVPENPTLEPNMKWIGSPVAEIRHSRMLGAYGTPMFGGKGRS